MNLDFTNVERYLDEIKSGKKNPKIPKAFANAYPEAAYNIVNRDVFWDYVV